VIPRGFQTKNWIETLFNFHIFFIPAQHWYEQGCEKLIWKASIISIDAVHAQLGKKKENSIVLKAL
jgi:hypothetical protein